VVGGWLFSLVGLGGANDGGIIWSLIVAVIGAIIVLWIYHAIVGRRAM